MKNIFLLFLILLICTDSGFCQDKYIVLHLRNHEDDKIQKKYFKKNFESFASEELALSRIENGISKLKQKGYLEASADSVYIHNDTIHASLHVGKKYNWRHVRIKNVSESEELQRVIGNQGKNGEYSGFRDLESFQYDVINDFGNNGYPFAQLKVDEIIINDTDIVGSWLVVPNKLYKWDSLVIKGTSKVKTKFLQNYLGITPKKIYRENQSKQISEKIKNLSFVQEIKPAEIEFGDGTARVYTYLEKKRANQFDGIVGVQSNKETDKIEFTGEVNLLLENTFAVGERIKFNWEKLEEKSQSLAVGIVYPYLFSSKLGIDLDLQIQKKDSTYLSTSFDAGLRFTQMGNNHIKLFFRLNSSSLIATDHLKTLTVLPTFADVKSYSVGLAYHFENVDYIFNPKKGFIIDLNMGVGKHTLKRNSNIPEVLYEGVKLSRPIYESKWELEYNLPLHKNFSFRFNNTSGIKESQNLFQNDLFRIGGLSSIRGFNEDFFRASKFSILRTEFRFIPQQNSSYFLFWDGAYYENEFLPQKQSDYPWGVGFGLNFTMKSGIFTLSYAVGKQKNVGVDLKNAKIHFGFVSRF